MKARGTLLMALPNKDQLKFHSYQDAKLLMEAIEKRYGGNKESKKVQRTLLKQQYENFLASSSETLDQTFDSPSSTNEADTTASGVSTAHTQGGNLDMNGRRIDFDNSKVKCFNCHKNGHFARECRALKNQDNKGREYGRKTVPVETPTENALIAQDGIGGQVSDKSKAGLGYKEIYTVNFVNSSEILEKQENGSDKGYHAVLSPLTGNYMPRKHDLRLIDEHFESVSVDVISNIASSDVKTVKTIDVNHKGMSSIEEPKPVVKNNFSPPIIEDWHSHDESEEDISPIVEKGKQHKASYKAKLVNTISKPLHMLHMDLFGPTNVKSLMKKSYCLVVTDDFSRFSWVFFLATKGETSRILKTFITGIENQLDCKVKVNRCDNGTEFKNSVMNQIYEDKGIKKEYSIARTPQQNKTEAVNTACYVLNRALVTKPHNKTPYELIRGRPPLIDFMKPFGCLVTILNIKDNLGKFEKKADEGYFVGYSVVSKAMRVFNKRTRIVEETLNIRFQENTPNVKGNGPDWLFDIESLTISMNYVPVVAGNQTNGIAGSKKNLVTGQNDKKKELEQEYILIPICTTGPLISQGTKDCAVDAGKKAHEAENINSTNSFNTVSSPVNTVGSSFVNAASQTPINVAGPSASTNAFEEHAFERFSPLKNAFSLPHVLIVTPIDDTGIFDNAYDDEVSEGEVDMNNVDLSYTIPEATKFLKDHPQEQVIGSLKTHVQTRQMYKTHEEFGLFFSVHQLKRTNHKDFQNYVFACLLSQMEPKKPVQALQDPCLVEAIQDE
nr:hypothetical protein [Tanacetum cinerariifolium]